MSIFSPVKVCCIHSCSPRDTKLCKELEKHLSSLIDSQQIVFWHLGDILPGDVQKLEIAYHIATADVVLLPPSSDFLSSHYCMELMSFALKLHYERKICVIPLILRPADWEHSPIYHLEPLPRNRKPITLWKDRDQAFLDIVHDMHLVVARLRTSPRRRNYLPEEGCKVGLMPFIPGMRSISIKELQRIGMFLPTAVDLSISDKYRICERSSVSGEIIACHIPLCLPGLVPLSASIDTVDCAPKNMGQPWVANLSSRSVFIYGHATVEHSLCEVAGNITLTY